MTVLIFMLVLSCALALALTPIVRALATQLGLLDHPDGRRKVHAKPMPVAGGLAILVAAALTLFAAWAVPGPVRDSLSKDFGFLLGLLGASVLITILGVVDDYGKLRGRYKLLGQMAVVGLVMMMGVRVDSFRILDWPVNLGWLAIPFTAFFLLGAINSLNLLDGMDGLLSIIGIIITLGFGLIAALNESWTAACVGVVLAGALIGFLRYNFPPASIFLGDSGSMLIGLIIGVLAIQSSLKATATIGLAAPLAVLTLPIMDTFAAIIRRKLTGRSIYATDRGHLHHCMLSRGLSHRKVLVAVACLCLLCVVGAWLSMFLKSELYALLSALIVVSILVASRLFGYVELVLIKRSLAHQTTKLLARGKRGQPQQMSMDLQGDADWTDLWERLTLAAQDLDCSQVKLDINAPAYQTSFHARWENPADDHAAMSTSWRMELPIAAEGAMVGRVELLGHRGSDFFWDKAAKIALLIEEFESALQASLAAPERPEAHPALSVKSASALAVAAD
ncbi:MAG TPA: MraY family glycosyltransferase [Gemmatales bacterium]|nr:MraY family glycosyltransferase [Gemmatales bacterium]